MFVYEVRINVCLKQPIPAAEASKCESVTVSRVQDQSKTLTASTPGAQRVWRRTHTIGSSIVSVCLVLRSAASAVTCVGNGTSLHAASNGCRRLACKTRRHLTERRYARGRLKPALLSRRVWTAVSRGKSLLCKLIVSTHKKYRAGDH